VYEIKHLHREEVKRPPRLVAPKYALALSLAIIFQAPEETQFQYI